MKRFILSLALTAGLLVISAKARATSLSPGNTVTPDNISLPSGSFVSGDSGSKSISYGTGSDKFQGTLYYAVYKESSGTLDFLYQVVGTSGGSNGYLSSVSATQFTSGLNSSGAYNASYIKPTSGIGGGFQTASSYVAPDTASLGSGRRRGILQFGFTNGLNPGQTSDIFIVQTKGTRTVSNSTTTATNGNGGSNTFNSTFAPTPEPASLVLLGGCLAGLGMSGAYRRWKNKPAVN